jgi:hypothetical protein
MDAHEGMTTTRRAITTEVPELLWDGWDDGFLFSAHRRKTGRGLDRSNPPMPKADALLKLREGWPFFGVCPRISQGQGKKHCSPEFDVVWCEIDVNDGMSAEEVLEVAVSRLEQARLADRGVYPSAIVFSGNRSPHLYFKLDRPLPYLEIEAYNRRLATAMGGDKTVINIDRVMRHPGNVHEKSGQLSQVLDFSAEITPVQVLVEALQPFDPPPSHPRCDEAMRAGFRARPEDSDRIREADALGDWREREMDCAEALTLGNHLAYIRDLPSRRWSDPSYPSRNEIEAAIVATLVRAGASDRQIIAFADTHLAKHIEKRERGGHGYMERLIYDARERLYELGRVSHPGGGSPRKPKRDVHYRWTPSTAYDLAVQLADGQSVSEWIKQIQGAGIAHGRTAYRIRDRLVEDDRIRIDERNRVFQH